VAIRINLKLTLLLIAVTAIVLSIVRVHFIEQRRLFHQRKIETKVRAEIIFTLSNYWPSVQLPNGGEPTYDEAEHRVQTYLEALIAEHADPEALLFKLRREHDTGMWGAGNQLRKLSKRWDLEDRRHVVEVTLRHALLLIAALAVGLVGVRTYAVVQLRLALRQETASRNTS